MVIVEPQYCVPSRRTNTSKLQDGLILMKDKIKNDLSSLEKLNMLLRALHAMTDLWSSRTQEPIIGVRFQYFNEKFLLQNRTVAYRHFGVRRTADNISAVFEEILSEYELQLNIVGHFITDNAANMLKAFDIFSMHVGQSQNANGAGVHACSHK